MTLDEIETNIKNLAENKKIMAEQVGAARDLLAELLMSYETLCDLQAREYTRLHKAVKATELEDEKLTVAEEISNILEKSLAKEEQSFNFDLEAMQRAVESPVVALPEDIDSTEQLYNWLLNTDFEAEDPPKKMNYCPHGDSGWCYASKDVVTNAVNGGCFKPQECPINKGD